MTRLTHLGAVASIGVAAAASPASAADYAAADIPAQIQLYPLASMSVTNEQFLTGQPGTAVMLAGELRLPQGRTGQLPTVVLLHGGSSISSVQDAWARGFMELGFAVFIVDSATSRGGSPAYAERLSVTVDAYAALDVLAHHPRVDPARIIVMGNSLGGRAALQTAIVRFNELWNKSGVEFAAHVALYPGCETAYIGDTRLSGHPIRVFGGEADTLAPVAQCVAYAERVHAAGSTDIRVTTFPGAYHAFDSSISYPTPTVISGARSLGGCVIVERPEGVLVNDATQQPFAMTDACVVGGATFGYDAAAAEATRRAVFEFLAPFAATP